MTATYATTLHQVPPGCLGPRSPLRSVAGSTTWLGRTGHHRRRSPYDAQPIDHPSRISHRDWSASRACRPRAYPHPVGQLAGSTRTCCLPRGSMPAIERSAVSEVTCRESFSTPRYTLNLNSTTFHIIIMSRAMCIHTRAHSVGQTHCVTRFMPLSAARDGNVLRPPRSVVHRFRTRQRFS